MDVLRVYSVHFDTWFPGMFVDPWLLEVSLASILCFAIYWSFSLFAVFGPNGKVFYLKL